MANVKELQKVVQGHYQETGKEFEAKMLKIGQLLKPNIKDVTKGEENAFDARPIIYQNIFFDQEFPEGESRWMIDAKQNIAQDVYKILNIAHAIHYNHENNFDNVKQVLVYGDIGPRTYKLITKSLFGQNAYLVHESRFAEWLMTDPDKREQHIYVESEIGKELDKLVKDLDDLEQQVFEQDVIGKLKSYNEELQKEYTNKIFTYDGVPKILCIGAYTGFGKSYMAKTYIVEECLNHGVKVFEFIAPQNDIVNDVWSKPGLAGELSQRYGKRIEIVIFNKRKSNPKTDIDFLIKDDKVDLVIIACSDSAWAYKGQAGSKKIVISSLIESYHEEGILEENESFIFRDEGHYSGTSDKEFLKGNTGYGNNEYEAAIFKAINRRRKFTKYCTLASATLVKEQIDNDFGSEHYFLLNDYPKKEQNMLGTSKIRKFHWTYENKPKGYLSTLRHNGTLEAGNKKIRQILIHSHKTQLRWKEEYIDLIDAIVDNNGIDINESLIDVKSFFGDGVTDRQKIEFLKERYPFKQCTIVQCEKESRKVTNKKKPISLSVVVENFKKCNFEGDIHYVIDTADKTELWDYNGGDAKLIDKNVDNTLVYAKMDDPKDPLKWLFVIDKGKMGINIHSLDSVISFCERGAKDNDNENVTYMSEQFVGRAVRLRYIIEHFLDIPGIDWDFDNSTVKQLFIDFYNVLNSFDVHVPNDSRGNWKSVKSRKKRKIGTTYDVSGYLNSKL